MRRVLLVVNPASRRGGRAVGGARRAFAACGVDCDVVETAPGHDVAATVAERVSGVDGVFTLGGDGTVMEVLRALAGGSTPLGVLPAGTGNLLARALRIPRSVPAAVRALVAGDERRIDLGALGDGRVFAFAAGTGIDASMVSVTTSGAKRRFGVMAYVAAASRASLALEEFNLRVTVDGVTREVRATAALVANFGSVLNGVIHLGPDIRENDGMLDLCVFSPAHVGDALRIGWRIARKQFDTDPSMFFIRGRQLRLETDPPRPMQADGELIGNTPFDVSVRPSALGVLVPRGPSR